MSFLTTTGANEQASSYIGHRGAPNNDDLTVKQASICSSIRKGHFNDTPGLLGSNGINTNKMTAGAVTSSSGSKDGQKQGSDVIHVREF